MNSLSKGFTLFEILVAIILFASIVTLIFGAFRNITTSNEAISENSVLYEMAQGCLARITDDLQSIYVSLPPGFKQPDLDDPSDPYRILGEINYTGGSSFSRLRFASLAHLPLNASDDEGVAEIVYYVHETDDNQYVLRRSDHLFPYNPFEEKDTDPILCDKLWGFEVVYYDEENADETTWDSDSQDNDYATPRAVEIRIKIGDEEEPVEFKTHVLLPIHREKKE
jgi:general secretion pathway protein J